MEYLIVIFIDEIIFMFPHLSENKILNLFHFNFEWLDMFWNVIGGAIGIFIVFIFMRLLGKEKYEETIYISGPDK